jgi:hypothetical protein
LNFIELVLASVADEENWGMIVAAKTAMITTTIKTSINVKAEWPRFAVIMVENSLARLVANPSYAHLVGTAAPGLQGWQSEENLRLLPQISYVAVLHRSNAGWEKIPAAFSRLLLRTPGWRRE